MTKSLSILLTILFFNLSSAQVGIGTASPNASSALDITSSNSGLLIPRVSLTSTATSGPITSPAISLLVYNTATTTTGTNDVTPGFYYWDGSWKSLKGTTTATTSTGWNLTGNNVTSTDYLGTNNNNALLFKVNNAQFGKFHPSGGITIGNLATANDTNGIAIGTSAKVTAQNGTAVGYLAEATQDATALGYGSKSSYQSVAIGLNSTTAGNTALAIGATAKVTGQNGIALGTTAEAVQNGTSIGLGAKATAQNGIAIGTTTEATQDGTAVGNNSKATGYQSTAFGNGATASAQNSTAIGNGATTNQANAIILGTASNKIGIGTSTPDEKLHVVGSVKIVDGTQASNYVLTSDNTGKATWQNPNANKAYAEIFRNSNLQLPAGIITFSATSEAANMNYVSTTEIQIKTSGIYRISYSVSLEKNMSVATPHSSWFYLFNGSSEIAATKSYYTVDPGSYTNVSYTKLIYLNTGQTVSLRSQTANATVNILADSANLIVEMVK